MTHLSESEFVDFVDGRLAAGRRQHAEACGACRARIEGLRETLERAAALNVPEPSPLYWDHLSARVRDTLAEEPRPAGRWSAMLRRPLVLAGASLCVVVVLASALWTSILLDNSPEPRTGPVLVSGPEPSGDLRTVDGDEAWALVRTAAEDVTWEAAQEAGLGARPGAAEGAALELTSDEQSELRRLLEEELKRSGA